LKDYLNLLVCILAIIVLCLIAQDSWATNTYVTDSFRITLRTGPSSGNKIIAMPESGTSVQILDSEGDWSQIRILEGKMSGKEGWVLSRYLMTRLPWEKQLGLLENGTKKLKEKMPLVENKLEETLHREKNLIIKLRDTSKALDTLQGEYASLKQGSADYLKLKEKYDETHSALKTAQEKVRKLAEENKIMRSSQGLRWFLAGALVLFFGLIIGIIVGKRQKKQRSTLIS